MSILSRNRDVHSPHSRDKMAWYKDCCQQRHLTQTGVNCQTQSQVGSAQLSQAIRLRPTDDLINVAQCRQSRDKMILDITKVHKKVTTGEDRMFIR